MIRQRFVALAVLISLSVAAARGAAFGVPGARPVRIAGVGNESEVRVLPSPAVVEPARGSETHVQARGGAEAPDTVLGQAVPDGIATDWWAAVQQNIRKSEYHISRQNPPRVAHVASGATEIATGVFQAPNRANGLRTSFTPAGIRIVPLRGHALAWELGLALLGWGYAKHEQPAPPAELIASANRIEYRRGSLIEWYVNDQRGLEQGFSLLTPPAGAQRGQPLRLDLAISGDVAPEISRDGAAVEFTTTGGEPVLRYADLHATDATGRELSAWFTIRQGESPHLAILLDDADAVYPVTIDPLITSSATDADWVVDGEYQFGASVATAGDVNGDDYDDVIVGAPAYFNTYSVQGRVFVYLGSTSGLSTTHAWTVGSTDADGWVRFGSSAGTAGDVNDDGYDDVIVGGYGHTGSYASQGIVHVYHGSASGLSTTPNWTKLGGAAWERMGSAVGTAGDVNDDGYDDVIVGAVGYSNGQLYEGAVFVYHGSETGLSTSHNWWMETDQYNCELAVVHGAAGTAGDVNGDTYDDVIFGARDYPSGGRVWVYHGGPGGLTVGVANWHAGGSAFGFGQSVGAAGNVNGDLYDDVIIGGWGYGTYSDGRVVLYHGSSTGLGATPDWSAQGDLDNAGFGWSVGTAGDLNYDSYDEVVVGGRDYDRVFLYFGSSGGLGSRYSTLQSDPAGPNFGYSLGAAGDVNGDTFDDVVVGEPLNAAGGRACAYYGGPDAPVTGLTVINDSPTPVGDATTLTATISGGSFVSYDWSYGDGQFGSGPVVAHTYPASATYTAVVTAYNWLNTLTATTTVIVIEVPISGLTAVNDGPTSLGDATGLTASVAAGTNVSYAWDFGDGQSASGPVVAHTYDSVGVYTATVTATSPLNLVTATTVVTVDELITGLAVSNDSPTELGNTTMLTATKATGSNVAYTWALGDGDTTTEPTVSHVYPSAGTYTAILTASNSVSVVTGTTTVDVDESITGLSAFNDGPKPPGASVALTATLASGSRVSYDWDFGDGNTGGGPITTHSYPTSGTYTVVVTGTNSVSVVTATTTVIIAEEAIAGLSASNDSPTTLGDSTALSASVTQGTSVSYAWAFGDGQVGSGVALGHVYPTMGVYTAIVTANNSVSELTATTQVTITPACLVRLNETPYASVQLAVNASTQASDVVKVAGYCAGVAKWGSVTQTVYLAKPLTVRGGYSADFAVWDPDAYPATLDAQRQGRVIYITGDITPTVEGLRLTNGRADEAGGINLGAGGGLHSIYAQPVISGCRVFNNIADHATSTGASGGGLYILQGAGARLVRNRVYSNSAKIRGGGIYVYNHDDAVLSENAVFSNMAASHEGGGLFLSLADHARIAGNTIFSNTAGKAGGGAYVWQADDPELTGNWISGNQANSVCGGGLSFRDLEGARLEGNQILDNRVINGDGGGICFRTNTDRFTLASNVVAENQIVGTGNGAGIYGSLSPNGGELAHTTVARNTGGGGQGMYVGGTFRMTNTIVASHTVGVEAFGFTVVKLEATLWGDGAWANGIETKTDGNSTITRGAIDFNGDPTFVDPDAGDYHIGDGSDAIDQGVDAGVAPDIDGQARDAAPDIGADEYRTCWARLNDEVTDYATVQAAVDVSSHPADVVKVAGDCSGVQTRAGRTQTVYLSRTLTIEGGYTRDDWTTPDPGAHPAVLDARGGGRVLYITGDITPTLKDLHITNGDASGLGGWGEFYDRDGGGGVYVLQAAVTISNCLIYSNTAQAGAGLALDSSDFTIDGSAIYDNFAHDDNGGGLAIYGGAPLIISSVISDNAARFGTGGGLWARESALTIEGSTIISNTTNEFGGGLSLVQCHGSRISGNTVQGNLAGTDGDGSGGGLLLEETSEITLTGNTIVSNTAVYNDLHDEDGDGGGLLIEASEVTLVDNVFSGNDAGLGGGGLGLYGNSAILHGNEFRGNHAGGDGGGLLLGDHALLSQTLVFSNTAGVGGGLAMYRSDAILVNSVLAGNQASEAGSGLYIVASTPRLLHTTIARNRGGDGSGVYVTWADWWSEYSTVALTNTILVGHEVGISVTAGNTATVNAALWDPATPITVAQAPSALVTVQNGHTGDPAFGADGYHLTAGSAAVDRGVDAGVAADIDGEPRPAGAGYDLGADELAPDEPIAGLSAVSDSPTRQGEVTTLTGTVSAGTNVIYAWAFGDGETGGGSVANHTYSAAGNYGATVTAANSAGWVTATTPVTIYDVASVAPGAGPVTSTDEVLTLEAPPEMAVTLTFTYTPTLSPTQGTGDLAAAGIFFSLSAADEAGHAVYTFTPPLSLTVHYDEALLPAGMSEGTLQVYRWDEASSGWVALTVLGRDTDADLVIVALDHLTEFALLGPAEQRLFLPLILRRF